MKPIFVFLFFISLTARSQTTPEIYNYVTKGYVTTLTQGLDFKKGYTYKEISKGNKFEGSLSTNKYQFSYRQFLKENNLKNTLAIMIVLLKNGAVDKVFCMPSADSDSVLWKQFFEDINLRLYTDQRQQLYQEIMLFFAGTLTALENQGK
jgi:hypothetical protein